MPRRVACVWYDYDKGCDYPTAARRNKGNMSEQARLLVPGAPRTSSSFAAHSPINYEYHHRTKFCKQETARERERERAKKSKRERYVVGRNMERMNASSPTFHFQ